MEDEVGGLRPDVGCGHLPATQQLARDGRRINRHGQAELLLVVYRPQGDPSVGDYAPRALGHQTRAGTEPEVPSVRSADQRSVAEPTTQEKSTLMAISGPGLWV